MQSKNAVTYLVGENSVDTLFVKIRKPIETFELILLERSGKHLGLRHDDISASRRVLEVEIVSVDYERETR